MVQCRQGQTQDVPCAWGDATTSLLEEQTIHPKGHVPRCCGPSPLRCRSGHTFANFPYALYATDVKFQPCERPTGRFGESKHYFSGKHHLYGLKLEVSVSPEGGFVDMSLCHPGSVHDFTIFHKNLSMHVFALSKQDHELAIEDNGEQHEERRTMWACLVDMGYTGAMSLLRAVHPKRRPK
ncbi:Aste57867_18807 [Aphanomyces stellatus]|uniref:Aste57867_18807 protein n=1 Tax=Aphanomyces stellatus TaxID=120398 RepID=A0A485LCS2_9STRA|nr:hypothetical protein As57867_018743 [Aphanomyces stellatus]VFT95541.1 Aste57867_18807 [Aphanomyces stellatus]